MWISSESVLGLESLVNLDAYEAVEVVTMDVFKEKMASMVQDYFLHPT